ncbi:MAG: VTT domain-containing protein [Promicromonosporaceae bacterium]|nr:VTT domain-containing protein [Promicromonosporaceae bacterium]
MDVLTSLNAFVLDAASGPWALAVLFLSCVVDGVFPPVPSETVLVAQAAAIGAAGVPAVVAMLLVAAVGAWCGDNLAYLIGRHLGLRRLAASRRRPRLAAAVTAAADRLERNGASMILAGRFVPVGRVAVNLAAGATGLPYRRYAALSALAACSWVAVTSVIGLATGAWLGAQPLVAVVVSASVGLGVGAAIDAVTRRRRRAAQPLPAQPGRAQARRRKVADQLTSQVAPPSSENACSQRGVGVRVSSHW